MEENKTQCIACLHDAHVESKIRWVLAAQNDAAHREACEAEELHARFGEPPSESNYGKRAHDYRAGIRRSAFAADFDLTDNEIERIDFALNEYQVQSTAPEIASMRDARRVAPAILARANTALCKAASALAEIEDNPYASSALVGAIEGESPGDQNSQIDELGRAIQAVRRLAAIVDRAQSERRVSDGLPSASAGAPTDPFLGRLLFRLRSVFRGVEERTEDAISNRIAAEGIEEFFALAGMKMERKTIMNRLSEMDETFPK